MPDKDPQHAHNRRSHDGVAQEIKNFVHDELAAHEIREGKFFTEQFDKVLKAFPDKDVDGHCEFHQSKIDAAKAEERFWQELKLDLAKKGLWAIVLILVGLIVLGFGVWVSTLLHGAPK